MLAHLMCISTCVTKVTAYGSVPRQQHIMVAVGHRWPTTKCHQLPVVAHHTDVQLIAGGPLATLFAGGVSPVVHQWQIPPSDCRLRATGVPPVAYEPLKATGGLLE